MNTSSRSSVFDRRLLVLALSAFVVAVDGTLVIGLLGRIATGVHASTAATGDGLLDRSRCSSRARTGDEATARTPGNLNAEPPPFFSRFERLAEIVGKDDADVVAGRERFRFYRERGYELRTHNLEERS